MALNSTTIGNAVANYLISRRPADGTEASDEYTRETWRGIIGIIYNDLKASLSVTPGSFQADGHAVTGSSGPAQ